MNLRNHLKPSIQTINTIKMTALIIATTTTAIAEATTVLIDRIVIISKTKALKALLHSSLLSPL